MNGRGEEVGILQRMVSHIDGLLEIFWIKSQS